MQRTMVGLLACIACQVAEAQPSAWAEWRSEIRPATTLNVPKGESLEWVLARVGKVSKLRIAGLSTGKVDAAGLAALGVKAPNLRSLTFGGDALRPAALVVLKRFQRLREVTLDVTNCPAAWPVDMALESVAGAKQLQVVSLWGVARLHHLSTAGIRAISNLADLREFHLLGDAGPLDPKALATSARLERLSLAALLKPPSIRSLTGLKRLKSLHIGCISLDEAVVLHGMAQLRDLAVLSQGSGVAWKGKWKSLQNLEVLLLSTPELSGEALEGIGACRKLKECSISFASQGDEVVGLRHLAAVRRVEEGKLRTLSLLRLFGLRDGSARTLELFDDLEELSISSDKLTDRGMPALGGFHCLKRIRIRCEQVTAVGFGAALPPTTTVLDLGGTPRATTKEFVDRIAKLAQLESLTLDTVEQGHVPSLVKLSGLKELSLPSHRLGARDLAELRRGLSGCSVTGWPQED